MKLTSDQLKQMTPLEYAVQWNSQHKDSVFKLPENESYFNDNGWKTAYDYEKDMAASTLSDVYKEMYGFRPRGLYKIENMSLDDIEAEILKLVQPKP